MSLELRGDSPHSTSSCSFPVPGLERAPCRFLAFLLFLRLRQMHSAGEWVLVFSATAPSA